MTSLTISNISVGQGSTRAVFLSVPGFTTEQLSEFNFRIMKRKRESKGWRKHVRRVKAARS